MVSNSESRKLSLYAPLDDFSATVDIATVVAFCEMSGMSVTRRPWAELEGLEEAGNLASK